MLSICKLFNTSVISSSYFNKITLQVCALSLFKSSLKGRLVLVGGLRQKPARLLMPQLTSGSQNISYSLVVVGEKRTGGM